MAAGIGYYPVQHTPYDFAYFSKYRAYAETPLGYALNRARLETVERHWSGPLVDVGIGCGQFVESRSLTWGYDVNPIAVEWLASRALFCDPREGPVVAATFWDSLEHIADPALILDNVTNFVFVSIPIFQNAEAALRSKHFRPTEHYWYFTERGLATFMDGHGWRCIEHHDAETRLGREDIGTFVFERTAPHSARQR